jgi:hypothetical protein
VNPVVSIILTIRASVDYSSQVSIIFSLLMLSTIKAASSMAQVLTGARSGEIEANRFQAILVNEFWRYAQPMERVSDY